MLKLPKIDFNNYSEIRSSSAMSGASNAGSSCLSGLVSSMALAAGRIPVAESVTLFRGWPRDLYKWGIQKNRTLRQYFLIQSIYCSLPKVKKQFSEMFYSCYLRISAESAHYLSGSILKTKRAFGKLKLIAAFCFSQYTHLKEFLQYLLF